MSYVVAGVIQESASGFYSYDLAMDAIRDSITIAGAVDKFDKLAVPRFTKAMNNIRRDRPKVYDTEIRKRPEPFQIIFFAMEANEPVFVLSYFTVTETRKSITVIPHRKVCPGSACEGGRAIVMIGENVSATNLSKDQSFWLGINDPISAARKFIQAEINEVPSRVRPPISILSIDSNGRHWADKGKCK